MDITPNLAYVYQPMPPQDDGRFYGVAGLDNFGIDYSIKGICKNDANEIVRIVNAHPDFAKSFINGLKSKGII